MKSLVAVALLLLAAEVSAGTPCNQPVCNSVPEPETLGLLAVAAVALIVSRFRNRK